MELLDHVVLADAVSSLSSLGRNCGGAAHNFCMEDEDASFDLSEYFIADDDHAPPAPAYPELAAAAPMIRSFEQNFVPPAVTENNISDALPPLPRMEEGSRIAFRIRTDEENLDDGFKWRKYGKKSVKNSPNPRNYYRCSTEGCTVKKRVERDNEDPSYLITTYEGIHNHSCPGVVYYATQDSVSGRFLLSGSQAHGISTMASSSSSLT